MSLNLYEASNQWASRPADERFPSLRALQIALDAVKAATHDQTVPFADLRAEASEGDILLMTKKSIPVRPTWAAFGSLCQYVQGPASFLRSLPATLACQNLNHLMKRRAEAEEGSAVKLLLHQNGGWKLRALTSDSYGRIPHLNLVNTLLALQAREPGWRVPPARPALEGQASRPATQADLLSDKHGLSINLGDPIADAGIYYGQGAPELFVFMVNEERTIEVGKAALSRGFFLSNDEGASKRALKLKTFYYNHVCGNHIVWDASGVRELSVRHVGEGALSRGLSELSAVVRTFTDQGAIADEQKLRLTMSHEFGADKGSVIDFLFAKQIASRKALEAAYTSTEKLYPVDGSPRSAWGMAQGLTRISQECSYADDRATLDKAAGQVLELPF